jgi:uncharacterized Fe-S cluster protein YjdI
MSEITYESLAITMKDYERYRGKHVVIYKNEIISEGSSSVEAVAKALEKHPELKPEDLEITYMPFEETLIARRCPDKFIPFLFAISLLTQTNNTTSKTHSIKCS